VPCASADVPEGCVIIREHIPITNLFTCLWFNEVDRFTSRDQLSFSTVRDKIMAKVDWSINMFLDCERRNFVIQVSFYMLPFFWVQILQKILDLEFKIRFFFFSTFKQVLQRSVGNFEWSLSFLKIIGTRTSLSSIESLHIGKESSHSHVHLIWEIVFCFHF